MATETWYWWTCRRQCRSGTAGLLYPTEQQAQQDASEHDCSEVYMGAIELPPVVYEGYYQYGRKQDTGQIVPEMIWVGDVD